MEDLDYIKKFSKISIKNACIKAKVNRGNLLNNRTTKENIKKVREVLEDEVARLYLRKEDENGKQEKDSL